jgi:polysaccharide biosynthesis/export protein
MDPIVDVRYLNYKVSVLGEVARPSVFTVPNEKLTLLEALGLAGDLTIFASRHNVLLIREEHGVKKLIRIDLTTDELLTSPYYYLKSNDIVYVEPNKAKISAASSTRQWLPIVLSSLTFVVVSIDRLTR